MRPFITGKTLSQFIEEGSESEKDSLEQIQDILDTKLSI